MKRWRRFSAGNSRKSPCWKLRVRNSQKAVVCGWSTHSTHVLESPSHNSQRKPRRMRGRQCAGALQASRGHSSYSALRSISQSSPAKTPTLLDIIILNFRGNDMKTKQGGKNKIKRSATRRVTRIHVKYSVHEYRRKHTSHIHVLVRTYTYSYLKSSH